MTVEERFQQIEHVTAGIAEERRKDREEYRQLWRDTQRELHALTLKIADTNDTVARLAEDSREADRRLGERLDRLAEESRADDKRLGERIDALVSAIGQFLSRPETKVDYNVAIATPSAFFDCARQASTG